MNVKDKPIHPLQSKTESELRSDIERFSRSELVFLVVLVAALTTESILGWSFTDHREDWPNTTLLCLGVAVAICCAAEYWYSHRGEAAQSELDRRTGEKVAEANERAANAELETVRLKKALSWREISKEQGEALINALRPIAPTTYSIGVFSSNDAESAAHAKDLVNILRMSGWSVGWHSTLIVSPWFGIFVSDNNGKEQLVEAFAKGGIEVVANAMTPFCAKARELRLFVGLKPTPAMADTGSV